MAQAPVRKVSEEELLSGDDTDEVSEESLSGLEDLDDVPQDEKEPKGEDTQQGADDFEVEIVEEREEEKPKEEEPAEEEPVLEQEDEEPIGTDYLTPWEKKNYSQAMQKRVQRERRITREERGRADAEATARRAAEARARELEKTSVALASQVVEHNIAAKVAEVKAAKEAGETDKELQAQGELDDLRAKRRDIESAKQRLEQEPPKEETPQVNPLTQSWMGRNRWFSDAQFADEANFTRVIDRGLNADVQAGKFRFGPNTPEYFAELDRRIHARIPALRTRIQQAYGQKKPVSRVAPVARAAPSKPAGSGSKVQLNRADLANMRDFGLDPKNPSHLKEYARAKRSGGSNG